MQGENELYSSTLTATLEKRGTVRLFMVIVIRRMRSGLCGDSYELNAQ
jgi:hypothetical protein